MTPPDLQQVFGAIDVYLFDQLMKGRVQPGMRILDAGCGGGRNLVYLLNQGYDVFGVDQCAVSIGEVRSLARRLAPKLDEKNFVEAPVESIPFPDGHFHFVICNAVLHFARDEDHFRAMVREIARVLHPGGILFARLMSTHGVESLIKKIHGRVYQLPTGSEVLLVDEDLLMEMTNGVLQGRLIDPLKSTIVHGQRTMTTWVVQKGFED